MANAVMLQELFDEYLSSIRIDVYIHYLKKTTTRRASGGWRAISIGQRQIYETRGTGAGCFTGIWRNLVVERHVALVKDKNKCLQYSISITLYWFAKQIIYRIKRNTPTPLGNDLSSIFINWGVSTDRVSV